MPDRRYSATGSELSTRPPRAPARGGIELAHWLLLSALLALAAIGVLAFVAGPS